MAAAMTVAVTVAVGFMVLARIDSDKTTAARRCLRSLGVRLAVRLAVP